MRECHGATQRLFSHGQATGSQLGRGLHDVPATTVVETDIENETRVQGRR